MNHSTTTGKAAARYALPAASCLVSGLAAYLFVFTNKLVNLDEIAGLFSKGESISSGRWALALTSYIFPDLSMPWFNGMLSLLLLTAAVCLIIRIFELESPLITALLSALLIVFPSQIVTFAYMFTCAPYALAVLLAVASVYFTLCASGWRRWAGSVISLCLSLGIYQAYLSVAASLYVVYLIKRLIGNEWDVRRIVRCGLGCLAALAGALAAYFVVNKLVMHIAGVEYNSYAGASFQTDIKSVLFGVRVAFTAFLGYFYKGYYHLVATDFSKLLHFVCAGIVVFELAAYFIRCRGAARRALLAALCVLFPLAVNCLYIASAQRHTLMLYSFTAVYVLAAVTAEELMKNKHAAARDVLSLVMAGVVLVNIFYANRLYLKMKLEYENAYAFYSTLVTRIKSTPGYEPGDMVYITGDAHNLLHESDEIDTSDLVGIMEGLINIYSRGDFLTYYAGFDPPAFDWAAWDASGAAAAVADMPEYPYDGSVIKSGEFIIVKLG